MVSMIWAIGQLVVGGVFLWLASEALVRGSSTLAIRAGISPLVIGLTIMALGTSSPELFVSALSSWQGNQGIALGNVIGSNMANLGLVLGFMTLMRPVSVNRSLVRREIPFLLGITGLTFALAANQHLSRIDGLVLLLLLVLFILYCIKTASPDRSPSPPQPPGPIGQRLVEAVGADCHRPGGVGLWFRIIYPGGRSY